jgi:hypothetical protein
VQAVPDVSPTINIINPQTVAQVVVGDADVAALADAIRELEDRVAALQGATGQLSGTLSAPPSSINLTSEGSSDWVHWGLSNASSVTRKGGVTPQIGPLTALGGSPVRIAGVSPQALYSWSDGTPTASTSTRAYLGIYPAPKGFEFTVPADTTERTLVVYLGVWQTRARLEVSLSDGSAPLFTTTVENLSDILDRRVALTYRAASAGQTLTVRYIQEASSGNLHFAAAALDPAHATPIPSHIDNEAAAAAGLAVGTLYATPTGEVRVVV